MALTRIDCPHCFSKVFVGAKDTCLSCLGNVNEKDPESEGLVPVEFVDGEELPPACLICGGPPAGRVVIGEKNEPIRNDRTTVFSNLLGALGGMLAIRIGPEPTVNEYKISVKVPVCERHRGSKLLKPIFVDYGKYRITLPAGEAFIQKWRS